MFKRIQLSLLSVVTLVLISCQKDNVPQTDYSIESGKYFQVISQHENGWIKEARNGGEQPVEEYEYYSNGYIKSAKVYSSYPQQHLYMEVSRTEDNKPLWSKYYTPDGELWFETLYTNGLPSVKKVYSEKGTAVHTYTNGKLSAVEFSAADHSSTSTTVYNRTEGTKKLTVIKDGEILLEEVYPFLENHGDGVLTSNQVPLANPFADPGSPLIETGSEFFQSPQWEFSADPVELMLPYRNYMESYQPNDKFATQFAVHSEVYQAVIEQYPVTENEVLIFNYKYDAGKGRFVPPFEEGLALTQEMEQDPELFELKYGNEYVENIHYGKYFFIIGALRNLPTASQAKNEIKNIAQRRMNEILNAEEYLSTQERELLDKIWFEVRFFSMLEEHRNGVPLHSSEDYDTAVEKVLSAESSVIQLEYIPYSHLITD